MISNISCRLISSEKKSCKKIPAIQWLCISGQKILTQTKSPIPPFSPSLKSQTVGPLVYVIYQMSHRSRRGQAWSSTEHNNGLGYRWVTLYNNEKRPILHHLDRQFKRTRVVVSYVQDIISVFSVEISIHGLKC